MNRRQFIKSSFSCTATLGVAGCTRSAKTDNQAESEKETSKWGLPSCEETDRPIKVRGASIVDSRYAGGRNYNHRTEVRIAVEVLGADRQMAFIKNFDLLDSDGKKVGSLSVESEAYGFEPGMHKNFEFIESTSDDASMVDNIIVRSKKVKNWDTSQYTTSYDDSNKACF